ncbi:MAG: hypothetical protein PQJ60_00115 [Spirochaetales bacterium]|nr:hypothetical protein [Spirochaetales bacterium]
MKDKSDFLEKNGYEFDSESDNYINKSLKNFFTLDYLYDNPIKNIRKTHECSDSTHVQFFTDGTPNKEMAREITLKYNLK